MHTFNIKISNIQEQTKLVHNLHKNCLNNILNSNINNIIFNIVLIKPGPK